MKNLILVMMAILVFAGCAGRRSGGSAMQEIIIDDMAAPMDCSAPNALLEDVQAFAPLEYCEGLAAYLKFKDDHADFVASSKKACASVSEIELEMEDIVINEVLAKLVDDRIIANGLYIRTLARMDGRETLMRIYDALVPSAYSALPPPPVASTVCVNYMPVEGSAACENIGSVLYPMFACSSEGVVEQDAREHFSEALAKYMILSGISTKAFDTLKASVQSAVADPSQNKRMVDIK